MVSIFVFWREKSHDSKYSKYASTKRLQIYHSFLHVYINVKIIKIFPLMVIFIVFFITNIKVGNRIYSCSLQVLLTNAVPV
jgi:hypothetical protein